MATHTIINNFLKQFNLMRILLLISALHFLFLINTVEAQMIINGQTLYGNEWINYNQDYYKCYITQDGMYRISTQNLLDAGVPINAINSGGFQVYAMGNQVPVYVSTNGAMGSNDYIEFYGKQNRGELDVHLYGSPSDQFNPYYSMFTDSMAYFLTWGTGATQFQNTPNDFSNLPAAEPYFMNETVLAYNNKYNKGKPTQGLYESRFSAGEGFGEAYIKAGTHSLSTPYAYTTGSVDAELNMKFAASSTTGYPDYNPADHSPQISLNGTSIPGSLSNFSGYDLIDFTETFPVNLLSSGTAEFQLNGLLGPSDRYSTAFVKITYPRQFNFDNQDEYTDFVRLDQWFTHYYQFKWEYSTGSFAPIKYRA